MFSTLRNRFGIPGVISVIALVFAMFGGAYAASNSSGGGKATASAKAKQGPRGKTGKTGPAGPAGPAGPVGTRWCQGRRRRGRFQRDQRSARRTGPERHRQQCRARTRPLRRRRLQIRCRHHHYLCVQRRRRWPWPRRQPWTDDGTLPVGSTETGTWSARANPTKTALRPAFDLLPDSATSRAWTKRTFTTSPLPAAPARGPRSTQPQLADTSASTRVCANGFEPATGEGIITPDFRRPGAGRLLARRSISGQTDNPPWPTAVGSWAVTG